jgi:hypothetical protein
MNNLFNTEGDLSASNMQWKIKEKAQTPAKLLISAVVFGAAFSYLFTNQSPGLNILFFVLLLYGFALVNRDLFLRSTFKEEKLITFFTAPVIFLGAYFFIGNTFLNALSILVILFVMFVQYLVLSGNALYKWYQPMFLVDLLFGGINRMFLGIGHFITGSVNSIFRSQSEKKKGAVIGILIGLLLLILIIPLLLSADPWISSVLSILFSEIRIGDIFLYIFLFLVGASMAVAPIATAKRGEYTGKREAKASDSRPVLGITSGSALTIISVVYVLYAVLQFSYFFEPSSTMASTLGLTSSQYAVGGFGELLFITCLNFVIIAAVLRFTKQENGNTKAYIKVLCTMLIAFNFVIMASSHMRLQYYEDSYGFTVARFISHSFMVFLLIVNVIMLIRIYWSKMRAIKYVATAALLYFCVIVAINPEAAVVRGNIQRYNLTGKIDTGYMFDLSGDAISEACDFLTVHPELYDEKTKIAAEEKYMYYYDNISAGWQSLNLADIRAYNKLKGLI